MSAVAAVVGRSAAIQGCEREEDTGHLAHLNYGLVLRRVSTKPS